MKLIYAQDTQYFFLFRDHLLVKQGNLAQLIEYIEENDVMDSDELLMAIQILEDNDHEVAKFGVLGTFLFSEPA